METSSFYLLSSFEVTHLTELMSHLGTLAEHFHLGFLLDHVRTQIFVSLSWSHLYLSPPPLFLSRCIFWTRFWQILAIETVSCITSHLAIRQLVDLPVMIFYDCKVGCFSWANFWAQLNYPFGVEKLSLERLVTCRLSAERCIWTVQ